MGSSVLFAKYFGVVLLVIGIGFFLDRKHYMAVVKNLLGSPFYYFLSGFLSLIIGLTVVIYHNIWEANWTVIITIFGWLALIKGIVRLTFPRQGIKMIKAFMKKDELFSFLLLATVVLGAVLTYYGFAV